MASRKAYDASINLASRAEPRSCGISTEIIPAASLAPNWGNPTTTVDPLGRVSFSHYASPQLAHPDYTMALPDTTDPVSPAVDPVTSFAYDAFGRVVKKTMPKGNAARTLDSMGSLSGAADSRFTTVYGYYAAKQSVNGADQGEQLKSTTQHGLAATTYSYDAAGRLVSKANGRGTTTYTYDGEGRLTSEEAPGDAQATTFTYDPSGAQLSTSDATGTLSSQYDEAGRTTETTDSFDAVAAFTYDPDGNVLSCTATPIVGGPAYTTSYSYDSADELSSETDPASSRWSFYYDSRGNREATQYPNGTFSWTDVNADGWTSDLLNRHGTLSSPLPGSAPADSQGSPIADFTYTYNEAGQKLTESRTAGSTTDSTSYDYDEMGRLDQVTLPSGTVRQYSFDLDSNRTSVADDGTTTATYTYDPARTSGVDELTSIGTTDYSYNPDGEVTGYGTSTVTWDGWQRMSGGSFGGSSVGYSYDAGGAVRTRTGGAAVTNYLLGDLFETDGSGSLTTSYIDGPAGDLAQYAGAPAAPTTVSYLYYNGHGDLAAEAGASGTRTALHTYDPFGAPLDTQPANQTVHRYTGAFAKQYDTASSLILMGARPYDPSLGRFLAVDPVDGGSLNNYDYAGQDPIDGYDLDGTMLDEMATGSDEPDPCEHEVCIDPNSQAAWGPAPAGTIAHRLAGHIDIGGILATPIGGVAFDFSIGSGGATFSIGVAWGAAAGVSVNLDPGKVSKTGRFGYSSYSGCTGAWCVTATRANRGGGGASAGVGPGLKWGYAQVDGWNIQVWKKR